MLAMENLHLKVAVVEAVKPNLLQLEKMPNDGCCGIFTSNNSIVK
jgi:hypothetical protein